MTRKFSLNVATLFAAILGAEFVAAQDSQQFDTSRIPKFPAAQDSSNQPQRSIKIIDVRSETSPPSNDTVGEPSVFKSSATAEQQSEQVGRPGNDLFFRGQSSSAQSGNNEYYPRGLGSNPAPENVTKQIGQPPRPSFNDLRSPGSLEAARADAPSILQAADQSMTLQPSMPADLRGRPAGTLRDESVRPISFEDNTAGTDASARQIDAMLERYRLTSYSEPLPGVPLSVAEALEQTPFQNRTAMMVQYWETFGAWCRFQLARERVMGLSQMNRGGGSDGLLVDGARALAENDVRRAEIALQRAQQGLQRFLLNPQAESLLALPSDMPLTEAYETQHAVYAARNRLPFEHRSIHLTLPKLKALLDSSGNACRVNDEALRQLSQSGNLTAVLQSTAQVYEARRQLIDTVVQYNQTIGDYSLKVAPIETPADRLAGMLVVPPTSNASRVGGPLGARQAQLPQDPNRATNVRNPGFNPALGQSSTTQNPIGENPALNGGAANRPAGTGLDRTPFNNGPFPNNNLNLNTPTNPAAQGASQFQNPTQPHKVGGNSALGLRPQGTGNANPSQNPAAPQFQNPSLPQKGTQAPTQNTPTKQTSNDPSTQRDPSIQRDPSTNQSQIGDSATGQGNPESKTFGGDNGFESPANSK